MLLDLLIVVRTFPTEIIFICIKAAPRFVGDLVPGHDLQKGGQLLRRRKSANQIGMAKERKPNDLDEIGRIELRPQKPMEAAADDLFDLSAESIDDFPSC